MADRAVLMELRKTWPWVRGVEIDRALVAFRQAGRWQEKTVPITGDRELTAANVTQLHAEGAITLVLVGADRGAAWLACYPPADLVPALALARRAG